MRKKPSHLLPHLQWKRCMIVVLGGAFLAFGMYNVHAQSGVTEGGVLGLTLLLEHWFSISPAISGGILNLLCYLLGWKLLGGAFIGYSLLSTLGFSLTYRICELFPPLIPAIGNHPLAAAILGAVFVGVGAGVCVRMGGATGGDDALAMSLTKLTGIPIQWLYLASDLIVLLLSLSYIPFRRIAYSLLTVILSGQIIGLIQRLRLPHRGPS